MCVWQVSQALKILVDGVFRSCGALHQCQESLGRRTMKLRAEIKSIVCQLIGPSSLLGCPTCSYKKRMVTVLPVERAGC